MGIAFKIYYLQLPPKYLNHKLFLTDTSDEDEKENHFLKYRGTLERLKTQKRRMRFLSGDSDRHTVQERTLDARAENLQLRQSTKF